MQRTVDQCPSGNPSFRLSFWGVPLKAGRRRISRSFAEFILSITKGSEWQSRVFGWTLIILSGWDCLLSSHTYKCEHFNILNWPGTRFLRLCLMADGYEGQSLGSGQSCRAWSVKMASVFGVLEYWSIEKSWSSNFNLNNHYSITPPLHYSSRLPRVVKMIEASSWVGAHRSCYSFLRLDIHYHDGEIWLVPLKVLNKTPQRGDLIET